MSRHNTEGGLLAHLNTIEEQLIHEHGRATAGAITVGILIAALCSPCIIVCSCFKILRCFGLLKDPSQRVSAIRPPPLPVNRRRELQAALRYNRCQTGCEPTFSDVAMAPLPPLAPQSPQPPPPLLPPPPGAAGPSSPPRGAAGPSGAFFIDTRPARRSMSQPTLGSPHNADAPVWASETSPIGRISPVGTGGDSGPAPAHDITSSANGLDPYVAAGCARRGGETDHV